MCVSLPHAGLYGAGSCNVGASSPGLLYASGECLPSILLEAVPLVVHGAHSSPRAAHVRAQSRSVTAKGRNGTPSGREVRVLEEVEGVSLTIPPGGWLWKAEPGRHEGDLRHT